MTDLEISRPSKSNHNEDGLFFGVAFDTQNGFYIPPIYHFEDVLSIDAVSEGHAILFDFGRMKFLKYLLNVISFDFLNYWRQIYRLRNQGNLYFKFSRISRFKKLVTKNKVTMYSKSILGIHCERSLSKLYDKIIIRTYFNINFAKGLYLLPCFRFSADKSYTFKNKLNRDDYIGEWVAFEAGNLGNALSISYIVEIGENGLDFLSEINVIAE